jgi:excisionase family DNA binding protein
MSGLGRLLLDALDEGDLTELAERLAPLVPPRLAPTNPVEMAEAMLTCSQAAQRTGTHVETIRRAVRSGALRAGKAGRSPRIAPADLDSWLRGNGRSARQTRRSPAPRPTGKRRPLADALRSVERDGAGVR